AAVRARPGRGRRRDVPGHDLAPCIPAPGRGGRGGAGGGDVHGEDARSGGRSHRELVPSRGAAALGRERVEDRSKAVGPYTRGARPRCRSLPTSRAPDRKPSDFVGRDTDHVCADSIHLHGSSARSQPRPPGGPNGESRTRSEEPRRKRGNETLMNPIKGLPDDPPDPRDRCHSRAGVAAAIPSLSRAIAASIPTLPCMIDPCPKCRFVDCTRPEGVETVRLSVVQCGPSCDRSECIRCRSLDRADLLPPAEPEGKVRRIPRKGQGAKWTMTYESALWAC